MQLAGYLHGRVLLGWNLMSQTEFDTYKSAISGLRVQLDPSSKTLSTIDFRHITQKESESISDFIRRLEHTFQLAFGHDPICQQKLEMCYCMVNYRMTCELISLVKLQPSPEPKAIKSFAYKSNIHVSSY